MSRVAAIILAAGLGTRFGEAKLLAAFRGKPLIRHAVEAALGSSARPVLVVVGHRSDEVRAALAGLAVIVIDNPRFADGLSTSLRAGFAALPSGAEAAFVLLGDMPLVSAGLLDAMAASWEASPADAVVPLGKGQRGNPVLLSRALAPEIARLTGDVGAGPMLRDRLGVREIALDDLAITLDADTPEALAALDRITS